MKTEIVKQAFKEAENSLIEKQKEEVKKIITKTLEKLEKIKKEIKELQEEEKILKLDIDDLKEGKLDRITERQEKDPKAKKVSVAIIIKEKEVIKETSPWYWPYTVTWQPPSFPYGTPIGICLGDHFNAFGNNYDRSSNIASAVTISNSTAKSYSAGTYDIDGHIIHLR